MTTAADVRKAVQPLLAGNPDLALVGRLVVIKPVQHILRGVYIDRRSIADLFVVRWAAIFLFEPKDSFSLNWGGEIYSPMQGVWRLGQPDLAENMKALIEREALAILRPVRGIAEFSDYATAPRIGGPLQNFPLRQIVVEAALGHFEACDAILARLLDAPNDWSAWKAVRDDYERITQTLAPLIVARDRAGVAALLHSWESWSVKKLNLETLWERSPFPVEEESM